MFDIKKYSKFKDKISYIVLNEEPTDLFIISGKENFDEKNSKYILNALKRKIFKETILQKVFMKHPLKI